MKTNTLTEEDAVRAYARMFNALNPAIIEPLLALDICYSSQWVFEDIVGKPALMEYFNSKIMALNRNPNKRVRAECGKTSAYSFDGQRSCAFMFQGESDEPLAMVIATVCDGIISRLDMCMILDLAGCVLNGECPR